LESLTLVSNLLCIQDLSGALRKHILSRAEGNPFYVEEVIRSLIGRGAIVQEEASGRWTATRDVAEIPIPDTLHGVLMARIDRLQEEAKRVLQMAAVIGRIFLYRVLAHIAQDERRLDAELLTLQREEMIRERARIPELEYIFKHELTREAAYRSLLKKDRRIFHRRAARALEELFPDRVEERLGLLAHHWDSAGDAEKAIHYLLRAGDQALSIYALGEAVGFFRQAERIARERGWTLRLRHALEGLAGAYQALGENEQALANLDAALRLSEDSLKRADLFNRIGYIHYMHMDDRTEALACYEKALDAVGDATDSVEMARISLNLGYAYLLGPGADRDKTLHYLRQAQRILERHGQWKDLALCYAYLAFVIRMESPEDGIEYARRALAICDRFGFDATAEPAYMALGHAHRMLGNWEQATVCYEAALDRNQATPSVMGRAIASYFVALAYLAAGRVDEAIELGKQSLGASQKIGLDLYAWRARAVFAAAHTLDNRADAAASCAEEASAVSGNGIRFQYALCCVYAQLGRQEEALGVLRRIASSMSEDLRAWALRDPDLAGLREQAEFRGLMSAASCAKDRPGQVAGPQERQGDWIEERST
jgi:tetratricopeptide (TPR) repeat protein